MQKRSLLPRASTVAPRRVSKNASTPSAGDAPRKRGRATAAIRQEANFQAIAYPPGLAALGYRYTQPDRPIVCLHRHQSVELGLCLAGSGIFIIENKTFSYRQGDVCIISETEAHLASSAPGSSSEWIFLNFEPRALCAGLLRPDQFDTAALGGVEFRNLLPGAHCPELAAAIEAFLREFEQKRDGYEAALRALGAWLLILLQRLPHADADRCSGRGRSAKKKRTRAKAAKANPATPAQALRRREVLGRLQPAVEIIAQSYRLPLGVADLARGCHLSVPHFRRLFQEGFGCAPLEYLIRWRVRMAAALLRGQATPRPEQSEPMAGIADLALLCGFNSLSAFNRHFKRLTGSSPRTFRNADQEPGAF